MVTQNLDAMEEQQQPLLSVSDHEPRVPVWTGDYPEFEAIATGSEIRAAAAASQDPYPSWIHAPLLTPTHSQQIHTAGNTQQTGLYSSVQNLQEDEIRELLIDHVSHHCCWGKKPAWAWKIQKVEDCNAYVGTLETFIEERDVIENRIPYDGRQIDGKDGGRVPGPWELDTRAQFPPLFTSKKEVVIKLPHSERVEPCPGCSGNGEVPCQTCTSYDDSGNIQQRKKFTCSRCNGRGLRAHLDGSDSSCKECKGSGKVYCPSCKSKGLLECNNCQCAGAFLMSNSVYIKWSTLLNRKVIASCHAASVPDEVFQRARGVQIYSKEAQQCTPVVFNDSEALSRFSHEIVAEKSPVPPVARIICERHRINMVPVTRVVMGDGKQWFKFYVIGLKKDIYLKNYPQTCCCQSCCWSCSIL